MPEMGEQQAPQQDQQTQQPQAAGGSPDQVIKGIHEGMMVLMDMMGRSQQIPPQDKQAFAQVVQGFRQFVQGLGGQGQPQQPDDQGATTAEQGGADTVPVG